MSPIVSNFVFTDDSSFLSGASGQGFVQVVSFPDSHVWIWIGDKSAAQQNLNLAIGSRNQVGPKAISSTNLISATPLDDSNSHAQLLAERVSKKLNGKPVYLSHALDLGEMTRSLELKIFGAIKKHPERF